MIHQRLPTAMAAGLLVVLFAGMAIAEDQRTAVVHVKDRADPIRGQFVDETADTVVLRIAGINTPINKADIERMAFEKTLAEQFRERKAELERDDYEARYNLARWAYGKETVDGYRLALRELTALIEDDPDNRQATLLKTLIERRLAAAEEQDDQPAGTDAPGPAADPATPQTAAAQQPKTLDEKQRNLLKVYELNLADEPRIVVPRNVIEKFLTDYRASPAVEPYNDRRGKATFQNLAGHEQLAVMFNAQARPLYGEVIVREEPKPLETFRTKVNPRYVVGYFVRQFGPSPVSGLKLITRTPTAEASAYTNFLMLHRADKDGLKLIDRDRPDQSLLLQWGLPRDQATFPAPEEVNGWRPYFTGRDDKRFIDMIQWIQTLYYPSPNYPIDYSPDTADDAEQAEPANP